jgi:hypothetical protein
MGRPHLALRRGAVLGGWKLLSARPVAEGSGRGRLYRWVCRFCKKTVSIRGVGHARNSPHCVACRLGSYRPKVHQICGGWRLLSDRPVGKSSKGAALYRWVCRFCKKTTSDKRVVEAQNSPRCAACYQRRRRLVPCKVYGGWRLLSDRPVRRTPAGVPIYRWLCLACKKKTTDQTVGYVRRISSCSACHHRLRRLAPHVGEVHGGWELISPAVVATTADRQRLYRWRCRACRLTESSKTVRDAGRSSHCAGCRSRRPIVVFGRRVHWQDAKQLFGLHQVTILNRREKGCSWERACLAPIYGVKRQRNGAMLARSHITTDRVESVNRIKRGKQGDAQ